MVKKLVKFFLLLAIIGIAYLYGLATGLYKVFPYNQIKQASGLIKAKFLKAKKETSIPEGKMLVRITQKSQIPNAESAPYKDCLYSAEVNIISHNTKYKKLPQKAICYFWAFKDRKYSTHSYFREYNDYQVDIIKIAENPKAQTIMAVDDIENLDLEQLYAQKFTPASNEQLTNEQVNDVSFEDISKQAEVGLYESEKIYQMLSFMNKEFAKAGIKFYAVMFPFWEELGAKVRNENVPKFQPNFVDKKKEIITRLRNENCQVIDLLNDFQNATPNYRPFYFHNYNVDGDAHLTQGSIRLASEVIASTLLNDSRIKKGDKNFLQEETKIKIEGVDSPYTRILTEDKQELNLANKSPILILGDSYLLWPGRTPYGNVSSANISAHISEILQSEVKSFFAAGIAPLMTKVLARNKHLIHDVKTCVFIISPYYYKNDTAKAWYKISFVD